MNFEDPEKAAKRRREAEAAARKRREAAAKKAAEEASRKKIEAKSQEAARKNASEATKARKVPEVEKEAQKYRDRIAKANTHQAEKANQRIDTKATLSKIREQALSQKELHQKSQQQVKSEQTNKHKGNASVSGEGLPLGLGLMNPLVGASMLGSSLFASATKPKVSVSQSQGKDGLHPAQKALGKVGFFANTQKFADKAIQGAQTGLSGIKQLTDPYVDTGKRLARDPSGTLKDGFEGAVLMTNEAAETAQKFYAERLMDPNTSALERPFDWAGGLLSSLATKENSSKTAAILGTAVLATQPLKPTSGLSSLGKLSPGSIGASFGSGFEALGQLTKNGGDFSKLNYERIGVSGATGYLSGSLAPVAAQLPNTFARAGANAALGGGVSAVDTVTKNAMDHKSDIFADVGKNVGYGMLFSGIGSLVGDHISEAAQASHPHFTHVFNNQPRFFRGKQVPNAFFGSDQLYKEIPDYSASAVGATLGSNASNTISGIPSFLP